MPYVVIGDEFDESASHQVTEMLQNPGYRLRTVRAGWSTTVKVYMWSLLNDTLPCSMKVCIEGANTKDPLLDERILSMAGVHRQSAIAASC